MLLVIPEVLTQAEVQHMVAKLNESKLNWQDGKITAGLDAKSIKDNLQLSREDDTYPELASLCLSKLKAHKQFVAGCLPKHILPPIFSRYTHGQTYGNHVDNAIQPDALTGTQVRTDVSMTLFLSHPDTYTGGELIIEDSYGSHEVKLSAGDAVIYPSTSLHRVEPVTQGARLVMVTWAQSWVKNDAKRKILYDMDMTNILLKYKLSSENDGQIAVQDELAALANTYHNLLRMWAD